MKNGDAAVNELWVIEPLKKQKPMWIKYMIRDEQYLLPDGIERHQIAIKRVGTRQHLLVIGGQRTF